MKRKLSLFLCIGISLCISGHRVYPQFTARLTGNIQHTTAYHSSPADNPLVELKASLNRWNPVRTVQKIITGNVTDENRNPVSGASVSIRGTYIEIGRAHV